MTPSRDAKGETIRRPTRLRMVPGAEPPQDRAKGLQRRAAPSAGSSPILYPVVM
jgi:hypothetical protein